MDPEFFYPEAHNGNDAEYLTKVADAKAVCEACPVRGECLSDAVSRREPFGIWGGKTTRERRAIRRKLMAGSKSQGEQNAGTQE